MEERIALTKLNISCGCGFKATDIPSAEAHSQKTGHTMTILGSVSTYTRVNGYSAPRAKSDASSRIDSIRSKLS